MAEISSDMQKESRRPLRVALAFPFSQEHLQALARGIADFARSQTQWLLTTGGEAATLSIEQLRGWKGDGIIAGLVRPSEVRAATAFLRRGVKVVSISSAIRKRAGIPRVIVENHAVGRLAAEHLLACGFRRFAFYGLRKVVYSTDRHAGFARRLREAGFACQTLLAPHTYGEHRAWQDNVLDLEKWLRHLTTPTGILAANDFRARLVIDACERAGLKLPDQVGIVGVDNDKVMCEFSQPQLSSIACDWYGVGREAARVLAACLARTPVPGEIRVPPTGVVVRASTQVTIASSAELLRAIGYIRDQIGTIFGVEKLLEVCGISRRNLEQLFRAELGVSPYRYLCGQRVERARQLLREPGPRRLSDVSRACGFHDLRRFRLVFLRMTGQTPAEFRRSAAQGSDATPA